jgi:type IV pilus biogenesis protein PilP
MRRLADSSILALVLSVVVSSPGAQTIADYSRAQRSLLEATMAQAAARSAALGASSASAPSSAPANPPATTPLPRTAEVPEAVVSVGGVFETPARTVAEIAVNGAVYLLAPGQPVPGTSWRVEAVEVDRVVIARPGTRHGESTRVVRSFPLPAPRWAGSGR